jgi:hypothetical protein
LIGSIGRECIDHVVVLGERHLRHVLLSYKAYYNATQTHLSLNKDAPVPRGVEWVGNIVCRPILGGLHHQYGRMRFTVGTASAAGERMPVANRSSLPSRLAIATLDGQAGAGNQTDTDGHSGQRPWYKSPSAWLLTLSRQLALRRPAPPSQKTLHLR